MIDAAGHGDLLAELADEFAGHVAQQYRIDREAARGMILDDWRRQPRLIAVAAQVRSAGELRRLRVYRDAAAATKRDIYYRLRRYRAEPTSFDEALRELAGISPATAPELVSARFAALAAAHASTAERLPHAEEFLAVLAGVMRGCGTVVDVGTGVLPLLFPPALLADYGVTGYWALDKDPYAFDAIREYVRISGEQRIRPTLWNLADGWGALRSAGLPQTCDLGLLLKVVPVVARQSPDLLPVLAAIPARRLLISGSRTAMAKRQDIERRESRVLRRFCADHGLRELAEFRTPDEFFLLVEL
jgi:16S rRNA (guanine(1405)-N(7))-methyltransferase